MIVQPQGDKIDKPFAVTIGEGRTKPRGQYVKCKPSVTDIAKLLRKQPAAVERWWSMHLWDKNHRLSAGWCASCGVVIDIDYRIPKESPPDELVQRLRDAAATFELPGAIFHLTPHGARIVWVYSEACSDRDLQKRAERGAGALAAEALERLSLTDYQVDTGVLGDLARYFYTPNAIAKGIPRHADVFVMRELLVQAKELAQHDQAVRAVAAPAPLQVVTPTTSVSKDFSEAIARWNTDHRMDLPRHSGECPICSDDASFGQLDGDPNRWYCFSTDHSAGGTKGEKGFHGDALDLEAHHRGVGIADILRTDGYLAKPTPRRPEPPPISDEDYFGPEPMFDASPSISDEGTPAPVPNGHNIYAPKTKPNEEPVGWLRSHSYSSAVDILKRNFRDVLEDKKIEFNEMSGNIEINRNPIKDSDCFRIRYLIEKRVSGGVDKKGNQIGMQASKADVFAAIEQIAHEQQYHPVRDYLQGLKWDGRSRLNDLLNYMYVENSAINQVLLKRFLVSAAARPLSPGCQVDSVFVLVGNQGFRKSSFFRALAEPWFVDTPIDITGDPVRAYMTLRAAWIMEWGELETLLKARRKTAVKAFITSRSDNYVPKHARFNIEVMRGGVIVGSTNTAEFLDDDSGERRYWPMVVKARINYQAIRGERDQLWAEAVHLYRSNEQWHLSDHEEVLISSIHTHHKIQDVWAARVLEYARGKGSNSFTTDDVLAQALLKEVGQWNRGDQMRIATILKNYNYIRMTDPKDLSRKTWRLRSLGDQSAAQDDQ